MHFGASLMTVDWVAQFAARLRAELGWTPRLVDLGGGLGVAARARGAVVQRRGVRRRPRRRAAARVAPAGPAPSRSSSLEPGRSLVSRAGVTLYTVGGVKRASAATTYVTVDGGMSDNPRPAMYNARYTALLATRADAEPDGGVRGRGQALRVGRRADRARRAADARTAATCSPCRSPAPTRSRCRRRTTPCRGRPRCSSSDGEARLIRRRETVDDLLALEAG